LSEYVEYLKEVFESFGPIQPHRMFGSDGFFLLRFSHFPFNRRLLFGPMGGRF
jgi:hypothetical protein